MHILKPIVPLALTVAALFALHSAVGYLLVAACIAAGMYALILFSVPRSRS